MRKNIFIFFALFCLTILTSCTRSDDSKSSKLQISIPSSGNGKQSNEILTHMVVNVSGAGISKPIVINWDNCHECTAAEQIANTPTSFMIEVPSGNDRLIQVLAVYMGTESGSMEFYYGDLRKNLSNAEESAPIVIAAVGTATTYSGTIAGRYLTGPDSGPSGSVAVKLKPEGKPALIIEESVIVNGWFSVFGLSGIPFVYELSDGTILFNQPVNPESSLFAPSAQVARVSVPAYNRKSQQGGGSPTFSGDDPMVIILGYFGNSAYTASKKVCVDTSHTFQYMYKKGSTSVALTSSTSAPPSNLFADNLQHIYMQGGVSMADSACSPINDSNAYTSVLPMMAAMMDGNGKDGAVPFRIPFGIDISEMMAGHGSTTFDNDFSGATGVHQGKLLPGASVLIDKIKFFKASGQQYEDYHQSSIDCAEIVAGQTAFVPMGEATVASNGSFTLNSNLTESEVESPMGAAACFMLGSNTYKLGVPIYRWSLMDYGNNNNSPVEADSFDLRISGFGVGAGQCHSASINLRSNSGGGPLTNSSPKNFNLAVDSLITTPGYALSTYTDDSCTSAISGNNISVPSGQTSTSFFYKFNGGSGSANGSFTLTNSSSSGSFGPSSKTEGISINSVGTVAKFAVDTSTVMNMSANECREVRILTLGSSPTVTPVSGTTTFNFQWKDSSLGTISTPSGVAVYSDNACGTLYSGNTITFTNEFRKSIYIKGTSSMSDLRLKLFYATGSTALTDWYTGGAFTIVQINPAPLAHHAELSLNQVSFSVGTCRELTVGFKNADGSPATIPTGAGNILRFDISSNFGGTHSFYGSSADCSGSLSPLGSNFHGSITNGSSQVQIWFKATDIGSGDFNLNSQFLSDYSNAGHDLNFTVNP
jgi:hypothetical protein